MSNPSAPKSYVADIAEATVETSPGETLVHFEAAFYRGRGPKGNRRFEVVGHAFRYLTPRNARDLAERLLVAAAQAEEAQARKNLERSAATTVAGTVAAREE